MFTGTGREAFCVSGLVSRNSEVRGPSRPYMGDGWKSVAFRNSIADIARVLLPEIQAFFENEDGQQEYAEWKAKQQAEQENKA